VIAKPLREGAWSVIGWTTRDKLAAGSVRPDLLFKWANVTRLARPSGMRSVWPRGGQSFRSISDLSRRTAFRSEL